MLRRLGLKKLGLSPGEVVFLSKCCSFAIFLCACMYALEFFGGAIEALPNYQVAWLMSLYWSGVELAYQSSRETLKAHLCCIALLCYAVCFLVAIFKEVTPSEFSSMELLFLSGYIMLKMIIYFEKK